MKRLAACTLAVLVVFCTAPARARMNSAALFIDQSLLEFRLEAPLQKLFAAIAAQPGAAHTIAVSAGRARRDAACVHGPKSGVAHCSFAGHARFGRPCDGAEYSDAFFGAIGSDAAFYRRVIAAPGMHLYADSSRTQEACTPGDTVPQGTPVNELRRDGGMLQVQVLDVLWHWAPPARCDAVHKGAVWIDASAVTADYPK